jgi:rare lipoprotein A
MGALTLMMFTAGCGRRSTARLPVPPARIGSTETGVASWYGVPYHGRPSASGEIFDMEQLTAAHRSLPFQTWLEVTNLSNGKQVNVRINDRGPFVKGRIIDLSMAAAREIDMVRAGTARVRLKVIDAPVRTSTQKSAPVKAAPSGIAPAKPAPAKTLDEDPQTRPAQTRSEGYAVQAGSFSDPARAEALRDSLPYGDARVVERQGERSQWRVLVGYSLTMEAATALAAEVRKVAGSAVIIRDDRPVRADGKE